MSLNASEKIRKKNQINTFIDSYRFTSTLLSNVVDNLSGVYDKECKKCMERTKLGEIVNLLDLKMVD